MIMNFAGLVLAFTAFLALMLQVGYQQGFDRTHPTSGRIYRVDKVGIGNDDVFRNILPRGYVDDIIGSSPHIQTATISCPFIEEGFSMPRGEIILNRLHLNRHGMCAILEFLRFLELKLLKGVQRILRAIPTLQYRNHWQRGCMGMNLLTEK